MKLKKPRKGAAMERVRVSVVKKLLLSFERDCRRLEKRHGQLAHEAHEQGNTKRKAMHHEVWKLYRELGNAYATHATRIDIDSRFSPEHLKKLSGALRKTNRRS